MNPFRKKFFIGLIAFLVLVITIVLAFIIYNQFLAPEEDVIEETEEMEIETDFEEDVQVEEEDDEEEEKVFFQGEYITAQLPQGWRIIEYKDGEGTESLMDMSEYVGLTAIDIINPNNRQVFSIQAVSGIGFTECDEFPIFQDNNPEYMEEQRQANEEMGEAFNTRDYTNTSYSEFRFLNTRFRRIGRRYFYDTRADSNLFEPPCIEGIFSITGLYFKDSEGFRYEAYFYGPTVDASDADLTIIDKILPTIKLVK